METRKMTRAEVVARLRQLRKEEDRLLTLKHFALQPQDIEWRLLSIENEQRELRCLFHDITLADIMDRG